MTIERLDELKKFSISKDRWDNISLDEAKEFIEAFQKKDSFLSLFENYKFNGKFDDIEFEKFDEELSENEFKTLPYFHAQRLFDILGRDFIFKSSDENSWIYLNANLVKKEIIKPEYFVNFSKKDGRFNIENAINSDNKETIKETLNAIARNLYGATKLRNFKGIPGSCPLATAYFMAFLSNETTQNEFVLQKGLSRGEVFEFFRSHKDIFEEFLMRMHGGLTVIAEKSVRNALVYYAVKKEEISKDEFVNLMKRLGIESSWRLLGSLKEKEILEIMKEF